MYSAVSAEGLPVFLQLQYTGNYLSSQAFCCAPGAEFLQLFGHEKFLGMIQCKIKFVLKDKGSKSDCRDGCSSYLNSVKNMEVKTSHDMSYWGCLP